MGKVTTVPAESSSPVWDSLEEMVRLKVREFIQDLLEEEITELVGRGKSERCKTLVSSNCRAQCGLPLKIDPVSN